MSDINGGNFEIATWYDTWNERGLLHLKTRSVPLGYATRYNLAFAKLSPAPEGGYTVEMTGQYADAVKQAILNQAKNAAIFVGLGDDGIPEAVADNNANHNRSTNNIVAWLNGGGYSGVSIDAESQAMRFVAEFVTQLGPSFEAAGLKIAVSVPWPVRGPTAFYGPGAVQAFNAHVAVLELQDYSAAGTPSDVPVWIEAGVSAGLLMGGRLHRERPVSDVA
ncbi:hypothetical protein LQ948_14895 [Jiella sp. MQZ9-1]|uniref:Glycosyl hydrolases family 18 n=1 Tax=Jiella flava TaxID=2816857 RepID=A0A939JV79_9HYPH|nr:hypothetical protein [Jiella flava]MBO0663920.1 hypothetical protein [Jiella flava]MCD2472492.1 hypothetical protein [Jiella flava]